MSQQERKDKGKEQPEPSDKDKFPKYVLVADVNKIKNYIFASVRLRHIVNASALLAYVNETLTRELVEQHCGKIIFTGGGVTQAIFTNECQAEECRQRLEEIYPGHTGTATTVVHLETWEKDLEFRFDIGLEFQSDLDNKQVPEVLQGELSKHGLLIGQNATVSILKKDEEWRITDDNNQKYTVRKDDGKLKVYDGEEFVDVIRRALRKVRQKKDATTTDSEAKNEESRSQPAFEPIAFSSGSPFFRICAQTGKEFATKLEEVPGGGKQEFGQSVWKQRRPKETFGIELERADRLKADKPLRIRLASFLGRKPEDFIYPRDFEDIASQAKPNNYLGFMDADGNGFGDMLSKLADTRADEKDYEAFSNILEETTRKAYIEAATRVLAPFLKNQNKGDDKEQVLLPIRLLIMGGDDVLLVTLPQLVLPLANEFCRLFQEIACCKKGTSDRQKVKDLEPFTMSAGVVIAHHKFPFLSFQQLGNRLLKSAKKRAWAAKRDKEGFFGSVDYQLITASGADDLKTLRKEAYTLHYEGERELSLTGKPYLVSPKLDELRRLRHSVAKMKKAQISRRQIKSLYDVLRWGEKRGLLEFLRWFERLRKMPPKTLLAQKLIETESQRKPGESFGYLQKEILIDLMSLLLFSVEMEGINLDDETIPPELRNQFAPPQISGSPKIEVQREDSRWLIEDKAQTYIVQKDGKLVSCYRTPMLIPSPWLFDERLGKFKRPEFYTPLLDAVELFDIPDELAEAEIGLEKKEGELS